MMWNTKCCCSLAVKVFIVASGFVKLGWHRDRWQKICDMPSLFLVLAGVSLREQQDPTVCWWVSCRSGCQGFRKSSCWSFCCSLLLFCCKPKTFFDIYVTLRPKFDCSLSGVSLHEKKCPTTCWWVSCDGRFLRFHRRSSWSFRCSVWLFHCKHKAFLTSGQLKSLPFENLWPLLTFFHFHCYAS